MRCPRSLIGTVIVAGLVACTRSSEPTPPPPPSSGPVEGAFGHGASAPVNASDVALDRGLNGLWMRRHWIHGGADLRVEDLCAFAEAAGISNVYPFVGPPGPHWQLGWRDEGEIQPYDPDVARAFFDAVNVHCPTLEVLPWSGGVLRGDIDPAIPEERDGFVEAAQQIVALGADGIHVNIEPLPSYSPGYLELLRALNETLVDATVSVAAYPPHTPLHPFPDIHWSLEFTRDVCLAADELAFMAYDTAQTDRAVYRDLVATWTRELAGVLPPPEEGGCEWRVGVPAYEDDEPWHRPDIETITEGMEGVRAAFATGPPPAGFRGIAVYASWTTDAAEWEAYRELWRGGAGEPLGVSPDFMGE